MKIVSLLVEICFLQKALNLCVLEEKVIREIKSQSEEITKNAGCCTNKEKKKKKIGDGKTKQQKAAIMEERGMAPAVRCFRLLVWQNALCSLESESQKYWRLRRGEKVYISHL